MIILGKNSDDKGTQLEQLTISLLRELGYSDIVRNQINSGGDEIDVTANFIQRTIKDPIRHEVICECKAYRDPVTLPEWLKFLGKLYSSEYGPQGRVQGCFIALNGVNGNVSGHYKTLKTASSDLQIIAGDDLITLVNRLVLILPFGEISKLTSQLTSKAIVGSDLIYYQKTWSWLLDFGNGHFTILGNDGSIKSESESEELITLIKSGTAFTSFVNLIEEKEALTRKDLIERYILSALLIENRPLTIRNLVSSRKFDHIRNSIGKILQKDINETLEHLIDAGYVSITNSEISLANFTGIDAVEKKLSFLRYFLNGQIFVPALASDAFGQLVDTILLDGICLFQGRIQMQEQIKETYIKLLRWSPTALRWACTPDAFLKGHANNHKQLSDTSNQVGLAYFIRKILDGFVADFRGSALNEYFHNTCGIVEVETHLSIKVKSSSLVMAESMYHERFGLGQMADELGGGIIPIIYLPDIPEPWTRYGTAEETNSISES